MGQHRRAVPVVSPRVGVVNLQTFVVKLFPRHSLVRHTGWMFAGQGMGHLLRAGYFVWSARLLGVLQYGVVVGAIALVNMVVNYGRLGSSVVFLRHVSAERS